MVLALSLISLGSVPLWRQVRVARSVRPGGGRSLTWNAALAPVPRAQDRLLFLRERAAGAYSTGAYFAAALLCDVLPLRCGAPPLFTRRRMSRSSWLARMAR